MSLTSTKRGQDAITIGIFTALYVVIAAFGMAGLPFGPYWMTATLVLVAMINGITFMMFYSRVYSAFGVLIMGAIFALFMITHGWTTSTAIIVAAIGATAILWRVHDEDARHIPLAKRRQPMTLMLSYAVFNLWYIGPILPIYLWQDTTNELLVQFYTLNTLVMTEVVTFIFSLIGAWIGLQVRTSHFERAGVA